MEALVEVQSHNATVGHWLVILFLATVVSPMENLYLPPLMDTYLVVLSEAPHLTGPVPRPEALRGGCSYRTLA